MFSTLKPNIRFIILALFLTLISLLYGYRLFSPSGAYFDEVYHVKRATILAQNLRYEHHVSTHPPLWHIFSALSIACFGSFSAAWRVPSLISGLILIVLVYKLAFKLTKNLNIAALTAFLFSFDCISITQARIGMLNSMMLMFMISSMLCYLQYFFDQRWSRKKALIFAGVFLGLGLATKFTSCFLFITYTIAIAIHLINTRKDYLITLVEAFIFLIVLPLLIFLGSHIFIPFLEGGTWADIVEHISYGYRSFTITKGHPYGSEWWSWPFMFRPIWYYFNRDNSIVEGIICIGNQAIFWLIPVSFFYLIWKLIKKKSFCFWFILLSFFSQWLPWSMISRVKFFHYFYTSMPFVCLATAILLKKIWNFNKFSKAVVSVYLILVVGLFFYWYPLLTAFGISNDYYEHHMWFKSWI